MLLREYASILCGTAGVVNTAIVLAATLPVTASAHQSFSKSLLVRMGLVKHKGSTSAELPIAEFEKQKEQYLSDISTEVLMNAIPPCLVNQTATHLVLISGWTMNGQGEKSIFLVGLGDKSFRREERGFPHKGDPVSALPATPGVASSNGSRPRCLLDLLEVLSLWEWGSHLV